MARRCRDCGAQLTDQPFCPNCGRLVINQDIESDVKKEKPHKKARKRHSVLTTIVVIFVGLYVVGAIESYLNPDEPADYTSYRSTTTTTTTIKEDLEVLEYSSVSDGYLRYVVGQVKNNSNYTYSYVQIEINLYNDKVLVGSTLDNVNNLEPGRIWEFKAPIFEDSCNKYKIVEVTGF